MAFSVEPGIYLVDEYGARIEDIVVCGPDGPIALNEAPAACTSSTGELAAAACGLPSGRPAVSSKDGSRPMRPATAFEYR